MALPRRCRPSPGWVESIHPTLMRPLKATFHARPLLCCLIAGLLVSGCGRSRNEDRYHKPAGWEYAELSSIGVESVSSRVGMGARQNPGTQEGSAQFETATKTVQAKSFTELVKSLGGQPPAQDCSSAVLNHLNSKGWEVIAFDQVYDNENMVVQDGNLGANLSESTFARMIWVLRRSLD